jgi:transposase
VSVLIREHSLFPTHYNVIPEQQIGLKERWHKMAASRKRTPFPPSRKNLREIGEAARLWYTGKITRIPEQILEQRLPQLPASISPDALQLRTRTRNSLKNSGLLNSLTSLERLTIKDLLEVRNFGAQSLSDLMFALSPFVRESTKKATRAGHEALVIEARKLRNTTHAQLVYRDDPRFKRLLRNIDYRARDARHAAERIISRKSCFDDDAVVTKLIRQLRIRIERVSKLKLEDELWDLTPFAKKERDRRIVVRRFGWDGMEPGSLRETGDSFGVAHEYVRVLCKRIAQSFHGKRAFAPTLDRTLEFVSSHTNQPRELIESALSSNGLVRSQFSLKSLLCAAEILGRNTEIVKSLLGRNMYSQSANERHRTLTIWASRQSLRRWGLTQVAEVLTQVRQAMGEEMDSDTVVQLIEDIPGFCWLDAKIGWFCVNAENTPAALRIKRALAVARRLPISDLSAVTRHRYRAKSLDVPNHVLVEFCRQLSWCRIEGAHAIADPRLRWKDVLPESEQILVQVFKEHGPILSWTRVRDLCRARGVASVESVISYSVVTRKLGLEAWSLLGAQVSARELQLVQDKTRPRSKIFVRSLETEEESRLKSELKSTYSPGVRRCRVILASAAGETLQEIVAGHGYSVDRARRIIGDFNKDGLAFLDRLELARSRRVKRKQRPKREYERPKREYDRGAASRIFDAATTAELLRVLAQSPGDFGKVQNRWTGSLLAQVILELGLIPRAVTNAAIYKVLRAVGIPLSKGRAQAEFPLIELRGRVRRQIEKEAQSAERHIRTRALILLARARGESQRQIARSLKCSPGTIRGVVREFTLNAVEAENNHQGTINSSSNPLELHV